MIDDREMLRAPWGRALQFWGLSVHVGLPKLDSQVEALAFIDLRTREVTVNPRMLHDMSADSAIEVLLAHELGHHMRYPAHLSTLARLQLVEREVLPGATSLLNLFTDYLINCELAARPDYAAQLTTIYRGSHPPIRSGALTDPAYAFFLVCFEEAWLLDPGTLVREAGPILESQYPGCRALAQNLAQELPNLAPNIFTQFIYFASIFSRFVGEDVPRGKGSNPLANDHSHPSSSDYSDAIRRSAAEREAVRRAVKEGWLDASKAKSDAQTAASRTGLLPGLLAGNPQGLAEAMAAHYRRLAEQYLFRPPPQKAWGEPLIPTTLTDWVHGDHTKEIDWLATLRSAGPELGLVRTLKREFEADEGQSVETPRNVRLEIYLDVSGSMPDPKVTINPMTLAALVLATSCLRAGGSVRALIYSGNHVKHWEFTRNEKLISRFLMSYIGGGTVFPFDVLDQSVKSLGPRQQPVRVVLTDSDFAHNLELAAATRRAKAVSGASVQEPAFKSAERAVKAGPFVALLNNATPDFSWVKEISQVGIRAICVRSMDGFPVVAAALARELFPREVSR